MPVLHGTFGEDGCIQGLLELGGCAYVGCGVGASAVGMNKRFTKVIAQQADVPVVPWLSCERAVLDRGSRWLHDLPNEVAATFGWPVIVKPCNLGSSAGVSVAATPEALVAGVLKVFEYDVEALIEPFIKNRLELNVAVAGLDEPVASVTEMPVTSKDVAAHVQREVQEAGRQEHRLERRDGRRAAGARPVRPAGGDARASAALRDHGVRGAGVRRASRASTS